MIIHEDNFEKAIKAIKDARPPIVFTSMDDDLTRKILDKEKIDFILIKQAKRKDRQKQRDSGFNQVMAKLAKKNNVTIGIDLDEITSKKTNAREKQEIIARIKQNIELCKKNKLKMKFFSKKPYNLYDVKSLGLVLGMPTWMTKEL